MSDFPIAGADAPAFAPRDRNGTPLAFRDGESSAPATLLFFFKHDCATFDPTAPLVERLHGALPAAGLRLLRVSPGAPPPTTGFFHPSFPSLPPKRRR